MSDLQCPATVLLVRPAGADLSPVDVLGERLRARRVAAVLAGQDPADARTAQRLADRLGLPVRPVPAGRSVDGLRAALEDVADLYRGETVAAVVGAVDLAVALPELTGDAPANLSSHPLPECGVAEVLVDADGWSLRGWTGVREP